MDAKDEVLLTDLILRTAILAELDEIANRKDEVELDGDPEQ